MRPLSKIALWLDFDIYTERVYQEPGGKIHRVTVAPEVIALRTTDPTEEDEASGDPFKSRKAKAVELAKAGHVVDMAIDVWGWNIPNTYATRRDNGERCIQDILGRVAIFTPPETIPSSAGLQTFEHRAA